ncbi:MAG: hypothetical protein ABI783_04515 [Actinomycetota bacterium]
MGVVDLDGSPRFELTPQAKQDLRDLRPVVELAFDTGECASVIPECAGLAGAALGVAFGDELDRAELTMLGVRLHTPKLAASVPSQIGARTDSAAGRYGA